MEFSKADQEKAQHTAIVLLFALVSKEGSDVVADYRHDGVELMQRRQVHIQMSDLHSAPTLPSWENKTSRSRVYGVEWRG